MLGNINKVSLFYVTYEIELDDQQQTTQENILTVE